MFRRSFSTGAAARAIIAGLLTGAASTVPTQSKVSAKHIKAATQKVDGQFMSKNAAATNDWPSYGLDYAETRFSKLTQITDKNVKDLGLAWS